MWSTKKVPSAFWVLHSLVLASVMLFQLCLAKQVVYGHVWPTHEETVGDFLAGQENFEHPKDFSLRHLFPSFWAKEHHHSLLGAKPLAALAADAEVGSESGHVTTSHIEEYHHPGKSLVFIRCL